MNIQNECDGETKATSNPLITFAVISYKQEAFIEQAIGSAFSQTYSPLEIIISDDCSPDHTFNIIESLVENYKGPHKIQVNRNIRNLGLSGNVNKVWELANGELVVFQAGDDISLPYRTSTLVELWQSESPHPDLVYSGVRLIDEEGLVLEDNLDVVTKTPSVEASITGKNTFVAGGCAAAYSQSLHWMVGAINEAIVAEDFVYSFRAMLGNGVKGISEPLVLYRQSNESMMGKFREKTSANEKGRLVGALARLKEYQKAMVVYGYENTYMKWRLNRRIHMFEHRIQTLGRGNAAHVKFLFWAILTGRFKYAGLIAKKILYNLDHV